MKSCYRYHLNIFTTTACQGIDEVYDQRPYLVQLARVALGYYLLNSHSRLSKGQTCRVFSHLEMQ
jgi:hypothetical protein